MKKLLSLLVMVPLLMEAQSVTLVQSTGLPPGTQYIPILSRTTYSASTGDTTGYFSIRDFDEVGIVAQATDSVEQNIAVDYMASVTGKGTGNLKLGVYTDSLTGTVDTLNLKSFYLRGAGGDRIVGADLIRLRVTSGLGGGNGTTAGRKYTIWLFAKKQSKAR